MKSLLIICLLLYPFWGISQEKPNAEDYYPKVYYSKEVIKYPSGVTREIKFFSKESIIKKLLFFENGELEAAIEVNEYGSPQGEVIYWRTKRNAIYN